MLPGVSGYASAKHSTPRAATSSASLDQSDASGTDKRFPRMFISSRTGLRVYHRVWEPVSSPVAVVYLLHGIGEHSNRYEKVAHAFSNANIRVVAIDHQGHGQSEGDRCYYERFDDVVADVLQLVRRVRSSDAPTLPKFLVGHSMGGLIAIHTALQSHELWTGVVLSGPALLIDPEVDNPRNRFLAESLSNILPKVCAIVVR
jgi:acylglycerol lipase